MYFPTYLVCQKKTDKKISKKKKKKKISARTFLVQWLRLYTPSSEDLGWIPGQETRIECYS